MNNFSVSPIVNGGKLTLHVYNIVQNTKSQLVSNKVFVPNWQLASSFPGTPL